MKVNPLNVIDQRKINYLPLNFYTVRTQISRSFSDIDSWIYTNLEHRYSITPGFGIHNGVIEADLTIGFESEEESTLFCLSCPFI